MRPDTITGGFSMDSVRHVLERYYKARANIQRARMQIDGLYTPLPSITPNYTGDIQGKGGIPSSKSERYVIALEDTEQKQGELQAKIKEWDKVVRRVEAAFDFVNLDQRTVLKLRYADQLTPDNICLRMGINRKRYEHLLTTAVKSMGNNLFDTQKDAI